jgi:hypothetical protein
MSGDTINLVQPPKHQLQDHCPPKKSSHINTEISLETLEILLTSVPEEEIVLSGIVFDVEADDSLRKNIDHVIAHKPHYLKRLQHLIKRKRGVEWLYRNISYFQTRFPWEVISLLENMAHQNTPEVTYKTLKPISERHTIEHAHNNYCEKVIGKFEGLQVLTTNIRRLIYNNIETPLQQLTPELIESCSSEELENWNNWSTEIESHIRHIEELLVEGQSFFSIRNFKLMEQLPLSKRSKSALKVIIDKVTSS